ncbi:hypothetical protein GCM10009122_20270 [Fulvivirga kasyanovii]
MSKATSENEMYFILVWDSLKNGSRLSSMGTNIKIKELPIMADFVAFNRLNHSMNTPKSK